MLLTFTSIHLSTVTSYRVCVVVYFGGGRLISVFISIFHISRLNKYLYCYL